MTSLLESVTVCASVSSFIALVRTSNSTSFSLNQSSPPSSTSDLDFSPPRYPLDTAVRSYGGSGSRETTNTEPSAPSSRSVRAAENPASPPPMMRNSISRSGTFELRLAFFLERGEALGRVCGVEQPSDAVTLARQRLADWLLDARVGGELDLADRRGGAAGQGLGVRAGLVRCLLRREQAVEVAQPVRLPR